MFVAVLLLESSVLAAPEVGFSVIFIFTSSVLEGEIVDCSIILIII